MLVGASMHPLAAQEKTISELTPQGGWNISRIDGNENTTDSYCALSRQYDQGVILTLGRNQAQEYSLAMDFQNTALNPDKSVSLTLQPGPGQIRAYEMMPASQRAIVVRLGYDNSFFQALEESKSLKAEVDGKNYSFSLPDIGQGQQQLTSCMQGLGGNETPQVASGFSAEKVDNPPPMKQKAKPEPPPEKIAEAKPPQADPVTASPAKENVSKPAEPEKAVKMESKIPKPEKVISAVAETPVPDTKVTAAPQTLQPVNPEAKTTLSDMTPQEPVKEMPKVEAPKVEAAKVEQPEKMVKVDVAETVEISREDMARAAVSEAPPPPPMPKASDLKTIGKKQAEKPAQALKIEATPSEPVKAPLAEAPSPNKIEISKVDSRRIIPAPEPAPPPAPEGEKIAGAAAEAKVDMKAPQTVSKPPKENVSSYQSNLSAGIEKGGMIVSRPVDDVQPRKAWNTTLQKKQREELERLKSENERLNTALETQIAEPAKSDPAKNNAEVEKLNDQIRELQNELANTKTAPNPVDKKMQAELDKLKSENEQLRLAMKAQTVQKEAAPERPAVSEMPEKPTISAESADPLADDPALGRQLANLKSENQRLSAALQGQEERMASFDAKSPEAERELEEMRRQLAALKAENKKLEVQARKTRGEVDAAVVDVGNEALQKIREYEKKYEAAQADNLALSKEIEELRRMQEDKMLSSVAGDWDLEQATKRYNEAEREIKRLGMLLEQQRMAHRQEKTELEQMLFDPAVTEAEQRRRLTELEMQLAEAERQLAASGRSLPARPQARGISPSEERISVNMTPSPAPSVQSQELQPQQAMRQPARQPSPRPPMVTPEPVQQRAVQQPRRQPPPQQMRPPETAARQTASQPARQAPPQQTAQNQPSVAFGQNNLQQLLDKAGISVSGRVARQSDNEYRWSAGPLTGHAKVVSQRQAGSLDSFAQSYIAEAKRSCGGDFASMPSSVALGRGKSFEIACISASRSTSSSVVFTQKGNDLIAISHETSAEDLDAAMDARDRVASNM